MTSLSRASLHHFRPRWQHHRSFQWFSSAIQKHPASRLWRFRSRSCACRTCRFWTCWTPCCRCVCFRLGHDQPCQGTPLVVWKKWYQLTDHCHQLNGIASFLVSSDYAFCPLEELRICRRGGLVTLQKAQQTSNRLQPCHICQVLIVGLGSSSMLSSPKPRLSSYQMLQVCHNESHIIPLSIQATCELSASIKPGDTWYKASLAHRGTLVDPESCSATNSQTRKTMENPSMAHVCIMFVYHTPGPCPCDVGSLLATWASQKAIKVSMISVQSSMPRLLQRALKNTPWLQGISVRDFTAIWTCIYIYINVCDCKISI